MEPGTARWVPIVQGCMNSNGPVRAREALRLPNFHAGWNAFRHGRGWAVSTSILFTPGGERRLDAGSGRRCPTQRDRMAGNRAELDHSAGIVPPDGDTGMRTAS